MTSPSEHRSGGPRWTKPPSRLSGKGANGILFTDPTVDSLLREPWSPCASDTPVLFFPRHALVVFGGLQGLEAGVDADQNLEVTDPSALFEVYLNTCPGQGSRTIRTEVSVKASSLDPVLTNRGRSTTIQIHSCWALFTQE